LWRSFANKNGYKLSTKAFYFYLYFFGKKGPKSPLFEFTQFGEFFFSENHTKHEILMVLKKKLGKMDLLQI